MSRRASRRPGNSPSDASKAGKPAYPVYNTEALARGALPPFDPPGKCTRRLRARFAADGYSADSCGRWAVLTR